MIRIIRPERAPDILSGRGKDETEEMCRLYDENQTEYDSGARKFNLVSGIYNHKSVKRGLLEMQHRKCCYCESRVCATSYGEVEHFRPKGAVQQRRGEAKQFPGYYWLTYEWINLLFSCEKCNRSKGMLFPLECPERCSQNHHGNPDAESPLFIDPSRDDPQQHLRFRREAVEPLTERGKATIGGLDLRRRDLEEARREKLDYIRTLQKIVELKDKTEVEMDVIADARKQLESFKSLEGAYSAMVRDFWSIGVTTDA